MTVKELKNKLDGVPDNMQVFVGERMTDFKYGAVNTASVMEIEFMEEPFGEPLCTDNVFVLTED